MPALKYRDPVSGNFVLVPTTPDEVQVTHQPAPTSTTTDLWVDLDTPNPMGTPSIPTFPSTTVRDSTWPASSAYAGAMCVTTDTNTVWIQVSGAWVYHSAYG